MTAVSALPAPVIAEAGGGRLDLAGLPEVVQVLTDCGYPVEGGDTVTLTVGAAGRYRDAVVLSVGSLILGAAQIEGRRVCDSCSGLQFLDAAAEVDHGAERHVVGSV
ncbi:hypothetical protein, partial [Streptosporangium sp. NPDC003464]